MEIEATFSNPILRLIVLQNEASFSYMLARLAFEHGYYEQAAQIQKSARGRWNYARWETIQWKKEGHSKSGPKV